MVLTFITATLGLLGWAGMRKVLEKRKLSTFGGEVLQRDHIAVGRQ